MEGLAGYGSGSEDSATTSSSSGSQEEVAEPEDELEMLKYKRAQELTAARKAANVAAPRQSALPDPLSAMASASGASAKFLNPEATKQINRLDHVQAQRPRGEYSMPASAGESGGEAKKDAKGPGFDIASLVPKHPSGPQKRQGSQVAAEAKRAKTAMEMHAEAIGGASALAIGALGGQSREGERERGKGRGAAAMPVEDFLANAGGSLPRQKKDRADKEKAKRMKGQSTHARWKSEAEMLLRQQYD